MNLDKNSPLRNLPAELNPRQTSYLDGVRYSIEMTFLAYSRLTEVLWRAATSEHLTENSESENTHAAAFLYTWSIVDSIHRLRQLLTQMPGVKKSLPTLQLFLRKTDSVEQLRHIVQHLAREVNEMSNQGLPVWGTISWYAVLDLKTFSGRSCVLIAGMLPNNTIGPVIHPFNKEFRSALDHVVLRCKNIECPISDNVKATQDVTKWLEKQLLKQFEGKTLTSADICLMLDIEVDSNVQLLENVEK